LFLRSAAMVATIAVMTMQQNAKADAYCSATLVLFLHKRKDTTAATIMAS
jgi:hypothetical protein